MFVNKNLNVGDLTKFETIYNEALETSRNSPCQLINFKIYIDIT